VSNRRQPTRRWALTYHRQAALMVVPYVAGLLILVLLPTLAALPLAFTAYNAIQPPRFIGLDNFRELIDDSLFSNALKNSLVFMVIASPLRLLGALALALLLRRPGRGVGLSRAAVYLPTVVPDIAWALVWLWVLNPLFGPLNQILAFAGISPIAWGVEPWPARAAIILLIVWQLGEGFVLSLAALQDIPPELDEQGAVDGSGPFRHFWFITLPLIAPLLLIFLMRDTILTLQSNFVPALIVTRGGPNYATTYLPLYIYNNAFDFLRFGYAAAMTIALIGITGAVLFLQYRVAVRWRVGIVADD
jgi:multiple sugar transport system permease protein